MFQNSSSRALLTLHWQRQDAARQHFMKVRVGLRLTRLCAFVRYLLLCARTRACVSACLWLCVFARTHMFHSLSSILDLAHRVDMHHRLAL